MESFWALLSGAILRFPLNKDCSSFFFRPNCYAVLKHHFNDVPYESVHQRLLLNVASSSSWTHLAVTSHDLMTSCLNSPKKLDLMLALRNSVFDTTKCEGYSWKSIYANPSLLLIFLAAELCDLLRTRGHHHSQELNPREEKSIHVHSEKRLAKSDNWL